MNGSKAQSLRQVISTAHIQKRVKELGRQISDDYKGNTIQALAVLENSFMFMADLMRTLDVPVVCQFIKPKYSKQGNNAKKGSFYIYDGQSYSFSSTVPSSLDTTFSENKF